MKKILVRGPALSQSGYGEHARFILRALRSAPELYDIYLITTNWGNTSWRWADTEERQWLDFLIQKTLSYGQQGGQFDISLQVTIPNEWERMSPVNIGVTAGIETTKIAPIWVEKSLQMDKIIVVSEHAKYGFDNTEYEAQDQNNNPFTAKVKCPIDVVGYPVRNIPSVDLELELKDDFNFLTVGTWIPRKNLENTIKWFVEEFYDQEVGLVVKTSLAKNCIRDRYVTHERLEELLVEYEGRKCSVYLLHGDLSDEEMTSIYQHPKIKTFISLTHGEGFGLPIFEAAYNGLPVIAPSWGGQCDFLYTKSKKSNKKTPMFTPVSWDLKPIQKAAEWKGVLEPGTQWCFPKEWDYKRGLKSLVKNYGPAKSKAKKLQKHLIENWSEEQKAKDLHDTLAVFISPDTVLEDEIMVL